MNIIKYWGIGEEGVGEREEKEREGEHKQMG